MKNDSFPFNFREKIQGSEESIKFISFCYMLSSSLFSAVDLDLFSIIEKGNATLEKISKELGVDKDNIEILLSSCRALDLILLNEDGTYQNKEYTKKLLTSGSNENIVSVIKHHKDHMYRPFGELTVALKSGQHQTKSLEFSNEAVKDEEFYSILSKNPSEFHKFLRAMNVFSSGVGTKISEQVDFSLIKTVIDLGGGGGQVSMEISKKNAHLDISIIDFEAVCNFGEKKLKEDDLVGNVKYICGDIFDLESLNVMKEVDCVILSAVLGDWKLPKQQLLIKNAYSLLKPGGVLLISETLLDDDKGGPLLPALMSLYVSVVTDGGKNLSKNDVENLLSKHDFASVNTIYNRGFNLRDLIVAKKKSFCSNIS